MEAPRPFSANRMVEARISIRKHWSSLFPSR
jgi:hypothetical protein